MEKQEFLDLEVPEKVSYLNSQLEAGRTMDELYAALGIVKKELASMGVFPAGKKFMGKPVIGKDIIKKANIGTDMDDWGNAPARKIGDAF
jgi:hypothetical protein